MIPVQVVIQVQPGNRGLVVSAPAFPGIVAQGESEEEAFGRLRTMMRKRLLNADEEKSKNNPANIAGRIATIDLNGPAR